MSQAKKHNLCLQIMIRFCHLCAGWTGRKYREIFRKMGKKIGYTNRKFADKLQCPAIFWRFRRFFVCIHFSAIFSPILTEIWRNFSHRHFAPLFRIADHRNPKFRRKKWKLSSLIKPRTDLGITPFPPSVSFSYICGKDKFKL